MITVLNIHLQRYAFEDLFFAISITIALQR